MCFKGDRRGDRTELRVHRRMSITIVMRCCVASLNECYFLVDMGRWITDYASRWTIHSANHRRSPQLLTFNAHEESRRGREDLHHFARSPSRPQSRASYAVSSARHVWLLHAALPRRRYEVLGYDGDGYAFSSLLFTAKGSLQSTPPVC